MGVNDIEEINPCMAKHSFRHNNDDLVITNRKDRKLLPHTNQGQLRGNKSTDTHDVQGQRSSITLSEAREYGGTPLSYFPEMIPQANGDHVIAPTPVQVW